MVGSKDVIAIVGILRKVTAIVKIYPFIYTIFYVISMVGYIYCDESTCMLFDQLFYTSPIVVSCNILLSYSLKLCKWHRLQCYMPMFPLVPIAIDSYIYPLSKIVAITNVCTIIVLCVASLINAHFVFFKPQKQR